MPRKNNEVRYFTIYQQIHGYFKQYVHDFNRSLLVNFNILTRTCSVVFLKTDVKFINMNLIIETIASSMFSIAMGSILDVGLFLFHRGSYQLPPLEFSYARPHFQLCPYLKQLSQSAYIILKLPETLIWKIAYYDLHVKIIMCMALLIFY